ncbi:unnamed protein product [Ceutorhynchus assimilis]|uniref:Uncharacterized protein n=1 Tax=Ceutorhynchus assimilis TaxID=467358 RepID=A0A9N9MGL0_9CUCU|nr:unnamed protein product [Ceutorhynchus assimilis]
MHFKFFVIGVFFCQLLQVTFSIPFDELWQLQTQIEVDIFQMKSDLYKELNKLEYLIGHLNYKISDETETLQGLIGNKNFEAIYKHESIDYCKRKVEWDLIHLDRCNMRSCKAPPDYSQKLFVEAKIFVESIAKKRMMCLRQHYLGSDVTTCFECVITETNNKKTLIFGKLNKLKKDASRGSLLCLQNNFNNIIKQICLAGCHFEECANKILS